MAIPIISDIIKGVLSPILGIVDNITDPVKKAEAATKIQQVENALEEKILSYEAALAKQKANVLVAEAKGDSLLQRIWRPVTMLSFVAIIVNNYILVPYVGMFTDKVQVLEMPAGLWSLLTVGIGGYIASRWHEKQLRIKNGNSNGG